MLAIERAGLNRALIRDVITDKKIIDEFNGVTGRVIYDGAWNNLRPIFMAQVVNSKFEFTQSPKWEKDEFIYKKSSTYDVAEGYR
jgi:hypothetical protein